jgi:hypothetical protein
MSALPPKADMCGATWYVHFVPKADISGSFRETHFTTIRATAIHCALLIYVIAHESERY